MHIKNNSVLAADGSLTFSINSENTTCPKKPQAQQVLTKDESLYEEICAGDFDDSVNENEFQTSKTTFSIQVNSNKEDENDFSILLDFVNENKEALSEKINGDKKDASKLKDDTPLQEKPIIPDSINLSELSKIFGSTVEPENKENKVDINGKIETSQQGKVFGDCWILAGINSLSFSEKGKQIIKDSITNNNDGTYTVYFKGISDTCKCTIPESTILNAAASGMYSDGDHDMLLLEIATETFLRELRAGNIDNLPADAPAFLYKGDETENPLNGGFPNDIIYLLTGKNMAYENLLDKNDNCLTGQALEKFYNDLDNFYTKFEQNSGNSCGCLHILMNSNKEQSVIVKDIYGNNVKLTNEGQNHSLSIKSVDKDNVTLINPWDSSKEITIAKNILEEHVLGFEYLEL